MAVRGRAGLVSAVAGNGQASLRLVANIVYAVAAEGLE